MTHRFDQWIRRSASYILGLRALLWTLFFSEQHTLLADGGALGDSYLDRDAYRVFITHGFFLNQTLPRPNVLYLD